MNLDPRYIIGIDLGTTNTALAYVEVQSDLNPSAKSNRNSIKLFKIPQLTGYGEISRLPVLPSFLYIPGQYDLPTDAVTLPWETKDGNFAGAFARDHGAKVPARLVASAKSWLCHPTVDKQARILPWGAGKEVYKVSPVQATAAYLTHLKMAWNQSRSDDEEAYMEHQVVVITVPASFDEVARDLTVAAATLAGLHDIILLEEPLAAFYDWLSRYENQWAGKVNPGELVLVCDVGGGTTDFTLITLREVEGSPRFDRIAVGDHLILGGDNVDLALARHAAAQMGVETQSLGGDRWKALCHQCRQAKEQILQGNSSNEKLTVMGTGSKLIADTLTTTIDHDVVKKIVLEGFFPLTDFGERPPNDQRQGLAELGLPYEPEPAVTRHLVWFLEKHAPEVKRLLQKDRPLPDRVLFNGGSLKPDMIQGRILTALGNYFNAGGNRPSGRLENPDPDLAVAMGAAYYGLVKIGQGVRVGSGSPRSYYLGIGQSATTDVKNPAVSAVCLVERGLDEGSHIRLDDRTFEVRTNQPVSFDIYSSSFRTGDRCGDLVNVDDTFSPMPPIRTVVEYGKKGAKARIPVQIEADYTEIGTLALWCRSMISNHRWQLQFQLRSSADAQVVQDGSVFDQHQVEAVRAILSAAFDNAPQRRGLRTVVKDIASSLSQSRENWPISLIRTLTDDLLSKMEVRKTSPEYESRWLNLIGFFLRPGMGTGFDHRRVQQLWKIYRTGPFHGNNAQVRSEWWIMWRRIAAGLKPGQQRQFIQDLTPLLTAKQKSKNRIPPQERLEMWMAAANMERLLPKDKALLGRSLLGDLRPKKCKPQQLWTLGRLGARVLLYGTEDRVVSPEEVSPWIASLLAYPWRNPAPVHAALIQMARKTGDPAIDVDTGLVKEILHWMQAHDIPAQDMHPILESVPVSRHETDSIFGERLPSGIVLRSDNDAN